MFWLNFQRQFKTGEITEIADGLDGCSMTNVNYETNV
jgi:hypothetical protein